MSEFTKLPFCQGIKSMEEMLKARDTYMKLVKKTFRQEMHCCGPIERDAEIKFSVHDGGGGEYLVINVHEWAFNDESEIDEFASELKAMLNNLGG